MKKNIFRTLFVSTLLAGTTFFAACEEGSGLEIEVPYEIENVYKLDISTTDTAFSRVDTVAMNLDSLVSAAGATRDDISGIELANMTLAITDSTGTVIPTQNFSNVKEVNISLFEQSVGAGVVAVWDDVIMASFGNANPIGQSDVLVPIDLLPYIAKPSFEISLSGKLRSQLTNTAPIYVRSTVKVTIKAKL